MLGQRAYGVAMPNHKTCRVSKNSKCRETDSDLGLASCELDHGHIEQARQLNALLDRGREARRTTQLGLFDGSRWSNRLAVP